MLSLPSLWVANSIHQHNAPDVSRYYTARPQISQCFTEQIHSTEDVLFRIKTYSLQLTILHAIDIKCWQLHVHSVARQGQSSSSPSDPPMIYSLRCPHLDYSEDSLHLLSS